MTNGTMTTLSRSLRAATLLATSVLAATAAVTFAAGRDSRDFVVDTERGSLRTGLLGQCVRTGVPEAGAPVSGCNGERATEQAAEPAAPAPQRAEPQKAEAPKAPPPPPPAPEPAPAPKAAEPAPAAPPPAAAAREPEPEPIPEPAPTVAPPPPAPVAEEKPTPPPPPPPAKPAAAKPPSVAHVTLGAETDFDFNKWTLRPGGMAKLDQFAAELSSLEYSTVKVVGHSDRIGSKEYNQQLSVKRANEVKNYLVSKKIDSERITAEGVGETEPVTKPGDCKGLKKQALIKCLQPDRRVEVDATATKITRD